MLERYHALLPFVVQVLRKANLSKLILTPEESHLLESLLLVLRPIFQVTTWLEGEKYTTLSSVHPLIFLLVRELSDDNMFVVRVPVASTDFFFFLV
jgi:hypothetical protein